MFLFSNHTVRKFLYNSFPYFSIKIDIIPNWIGLQVHGITSKEAHKSSTLDRSPRPRNPPRNLMQLSFGAYKSFPNMADVLCFKENLTFGKHIIATEDISVNEWIMIAKPFATIEHLIHTCSGCFECGKSSKFQIQCPHLTLHWWMVLQQSLQNRYVAPNEIQSKIRSQWLPNRSDRDRGYHCCINAVSDITTLLEFCRGLLYSNKRSEKWNEQLFISYLGDMEFETNAEHRENLKDSLNFDCQCKLCEQ